jgi:peptidyl-tRNA hydrolase
MLVHAAGESSAIRLANLPEDTHAIVLTAEGEPALAALSERLTKAGVQHVMIRDTPSGRRQPDAPWNGALMALGIVPGEREVLRRFFSSLPLLK